MEKRHSLFGKASFFIGLATMLLFYPVAFLMAAVTRSNDPAVAAKGHYLTLIIECGFPLAILVGIGLGLAGLTQKDKKRYSILGLTFLLVTILEVTISTLILMHNSRF